MSQEKYYADIAGKALIPDAELLWITEGSAKIPAVIAADLDGDGLNEIAAVYKLDNQLYAVILKNYDNVWHPIADLKGIGYNITHISACAVTSEHKNNLIIGWQLGAVWSQLGLYELKDNSLTSMLNEEVSFTKIDLLHNCPGDEDEHRCRLALWSHDTGEAYVVEVYKWRDNKLVPAPECYEEYFKKVAAYYERKTSENPKAAFYWYYLADAYLKTKEFSKALEAINKAIEINLPYPPQEELERLKNEILSNIGCRIKYLYPASVKAIGGTKWGYLDARGNFLIKPRYDYAMDFQDNGLAIVIYNNLSGIINDEGNYVVEPKYGSISEFSEGRAVVIDEGGFKIIDEKGKVLTDKPHNFIASYSEGRALFSDITDKDVYLYGYLDLDAQEVIPLKYLSANDFYGGKALVQLLESEFALIDKDGKETVTFKYPFIGPPGDGLLAFKETAEGKYGYIDERGKIIIPPKFTYAYPFQDGRAVVDTSEDPAKNNQGVIDNRGNYVIDPGFNDILQLGQGRFAAGKAIDEERPFIGSIYAIADNHGNILTDFIYTNVTEYKEGYASVSEGESTFFIDKEGKKAENLPEVRGTGTLSFIHSLIRGNIDNRVLYLDKEGRIVWRQNTVIPLNDRYRVVEEKFKPNRDYLVYYPQLQGLNDEKVQQEINEKLKDLSQVKPIESDEQLDYSYTGDFSVELFKKDLLVLQLEGYNFPFGAAHGMPTKIFAHVDLTSGEFYRLPDLFKAGSNYVEVLSDIIGDMIKNDPQYSYVFPDSYKGIAPDQPFYVDEDNLYIYFNPYDIAPYAAGFPTFKIPFSQIEDIIDKEGRFWNSFH